MSFEVNPTISSGKYTLAATPDTLVAIMSHAHRGLVDVVGGAADPDAMYYVQSAPYKRTVDGRVLEEGDVRGYFVPQEVPQRNVLTSNPRADGLGMYCEVQRLLCHHSVNAAMPMQFGPHRIAGSAIWQLKTRDPSVRCGRLAGFLNALDENKADREAVNDLATMVERVRAAAENAMLKDEAREYFAFDNAGKGITGRDAWPVTVGYILGVDATVIDPKATKIVKSFTRDKSIRTALGRLCESGEIDEYTSELRILSDLVGCVIPSNLADAAAMVYLVTNRPLPYPDVNYGELVHYFGRSVNRLLHYLNDETGATAASLGIIVPTTVIGDGGRDSVIAAAVASAVAKKSGQTVRLVTILPSPTAEEPIDPRYIEYLIHAGHEVLHHPDSRNGRSVTKYAKLFGPAPSSD